ncbi:MAG: hypothetical protein H0V70_03235 [Ktedonobacteraceae bacterium]|nr:hypothetical protein [Ktedonobacteraceae bacterium]
MTETTLPPLTQAEREQLWPALPLKEWQDTYRTVHMWTQIVGKVKLELHPYINHWWHTTLLVTPRGLTTGSIPYGRNTFEINFDFIDHQLFLLTSQGAIRSMPLIPRSVADFYREFMALLRAENIHVAINTLPNEVTDPIHCDVNERDASYDVVTINRFWRILVQVDRVFKEFRSDFIGKSSPVHFFWGAFDLAVTRFSGQRAPERKGADAVTREGYSHEVISCGFWPGGGPIAGPAFYAYAAPEPDGLKTATIRPQEAFYHPDLSEFLLMYDDVRKAASPDQMILDFCQSTYDAAATLAHWDRAALERQHNIP